MSAFLRDLLLSYTLPIYEVINLSVYFTEPKIHIFFPEAKVANIKNLENALKMRLDSNLKNL